MHAEQIREYCLRKAGVTEGMPFGETVLVFKVYDKIFLLLALDARPLQFNVKCDPEQAIEWREEFSGGVIPGYHMNKKHWNTVICNGMVDESKMALMIDHSYDLIVASLPAKKRNELGISSNKARKNP